MIFEQQFYTVPTRSDEFPRNDGERKVVENVTFGQAITVIERFCKQLEHFHHYKVVQSPKKRWRIDVHVFCLDSGNILEGSKTGRALPYLRCMFTIKDDRNHDEWCDREDFNVDKII